MNRRPYHLKQQRRHKHPSQCLLFSIEISFISHFPILYTVLTFYITFLLSNKINCIAILKIPLKRTETIWQKELSVES